MTTDALELNMNSEISSYLDWSLKEGLWDGKPVSWMDASTFHAQMHSRILQLLANADDKLAAQFACIGSQPSNRDLLAIDIQTLDFSKNELILQVGLRKSVSSFWKKHKTEILIGAAIVATIAVVTIIALSTCGSGAGAAIAAGGALLGDNLDEESSPQKTPSQTASLQPSKTEPVLPLIDHLEDKVIFGETGAFINGQYCSYTDILQNRTGPNLPQHSSWIENTQDTIGNSIFETNRLPSKEPQFDNPISSRFSTLGEYPSYHRINGVNGINTNMKDALDHANYIAQLTQSNQPIDWTYNHSHGAIVDLAECLTLNYLGFSPITSDLLQDQWKDFHNSNLTQPDIKLLQLCYSQGAIHVRNALFDSPPEIQKRIIVVAIAPAEIVPKELCADSYNYASKSDFINYGKLFTVGLFDSDECGLSKSAQEVLRLRNELILLTPHPEATGIDHDFQSPTFKKYLEYHIRDYLQQKEAK